MCGRSEADPLPRPELLSRDPGTPSASNWKGLTRAEDFTGDCNRAVVAAEDVWVCCRLTVPKSVRCEQDRH
ncbi:hypothetical protein MMOR_56060 [Mycolicibacterium moriokaense]|uniref:Uncharacterized protein n=1 Tax=Mycolicibacterium moriokaense TaxID=39691 RepID=A0AAD1HH37_9MYCO|nr:hypothetical protein MMOR_56060 [Mycolicibacterium moriokaense]